MALEKAYPLDITTLYPVETDIYLTGLEAVGAFSTPQELVDTVPEATLQMAEQAITTVRNIETARRRLSYYASVFFALEKDHPEAVERLPQEFKDIVRELARRSALATVTEVGELLT